MEANLVQQRMLTAKGKLSFATIPAAGVHGVGVRHLPGNLSRLARGLFVARRLLRQFQPDVLFFTGGYLAVPMALAGRKIPSLSYVPDIEPGLALKTLARFSTHIALTTEELRGYSRPAPGCLSPVILPVPTWRSGAGSRLPKPASPWDSRLASRFSWWLAEARGHVRLTRLWLLPSRFCSKNSRSSI